MVEAFSLLAPRGQEAIPSQRYDCWLSMTGDLLAEFHHTRDGYLVRFPDQADFRINRHSFRVECIPVPDVTSTVPATLFANAIRPMIANHTGGIYLHGSAAAIDDKAVAFVGPSRRGKTTLAGALAKAGHPFLTEDVIQIDHTDEQFLLVPQTPQLRLHSDSASFLLDCDEGMLAESDGKRVIEASDILAFGDQALPLHAIFILGPGESEAPEITPISRLEGISQLLQQSFVLDVEDRPGLAAHFQRLSDLARAVPCYDLDYQRDFAKLPEVIALVARHIASHN